jgi:hypothetical protein
MMSLLPAVETLAMVDHSALGRPMTPLSRDVSICGSVVLPDGVRR